MTPEQEALFELARTLERLGIPHMVTGVVRWGHALGVLDLWREIAGEEPAAP